MNEKDDNSIVYRIGVVALGLVLGLLFFAYVDGDRSREHPIPEGIVTNKLWVDEYWEAGEQLYPERWCFELNYREEVCVPEKYWNQYTIGDWYGK